MWLKVECFERSTATDIANSWSGNRGEVFLGITWDAFKVTLRGSIAWIIKKLRSNREWKVRDCDQVATDAEVESIRDPNSTNFVVWRDKARQLDLMLVERPRKSCCNNHNIYSNLVIRIANY